MRNHFNIGVYEIEGALLFASSFFIVDLLNNNDTISFI